MNSTNLRNKIGGFILALAVIPGVAIVGGATAQAQEQRNSTRQRDGVRNLPQNDRDDQDRGRNRDDRFRGRNRDDRNRHQDDRYRQNQRRGSYGNNGYGNRGYGNNGYGNNGYGNNGYGNNGYGNNGYGNRGGYGNGSVAASQGFQDGLSTGASDASRGQSYNPQRSHFFQNGNGGQAYRNAFLRGYQEGYQRNGGNGRGGNNRGRNNGGRFPW